MNEICRISSDCNNNTVCCTKEGDRNPDNSWEGTCTKPCIKNGKGYCKKYAESKNILCEKKIGSYCLNDNECIGWGESNVNGKNVTCCKAKCTDNNGNCPKSNVGEKCKKTSECIGNNTICCDFAGNVIVGKNWGTCNKIKCMKDGKALCPNSNEICDKKEKDS